MFKLRRAYLKSHTLSMELGQEWWDEKSSVVSFRENTLLSLLRRWLFCCGASWSHGSVLDRDSVHAFNDTVDLFTVLRETRGPTQRPCQNQNYLLSEWAESLVQQDYVILSLWVCETGDDCFISHRFHTDFAMGCGSCWETQFKRRSAKSV